MYVSLSSCSQQAKKEKRPTGGIPVACDQSNKVKAYERVYDQSLNSWRSKYERVSLAGRRI